LVRIILEKEETKDIKNKIEKSFDQNPSKFTENLIKIFPGLISHRDSIENKIRSLNKFSTTRAAIIGLLTIFLMTYIPSLYKIKSIEQEYSELVKNQEQQPKSKQHELEIFRQTIELSNPQWKNSRLEIEELEKKIEIDFKNMLKSGVLNNQKFVLEGVKSYSETKASIHFAYGNTFSDDTLIHVDFFSIIPKKMAKGLKEGNSYSFDFEPLRKLTYGENENYSYAMIYSPFLRVSDSKILRYGNKPSHLEISLGMWLVKVTKIKENN